MAPSRPGLDSSYFFATTLPLMVMLSSTTRPPPAFAPASGPWSSITAMLLTCWPGVIGGDTCSGLLGSNRMRFQPIAREVLVVPLTQPADTCVTSSLVTTTKCGDPA